MVGLQAKECQAWPVNRPKPGEGVTIVTPSSQEKKPPLPRTGTSVSIGNLISKGIVSPPVLYWSQLQYKTPGQGSPITGSPVGRGLLERKARFPPGCQQGEMTPDPSQARGNPQGEP